MKDEVLKNVTDHYKNRMFTIASAIADGKLSHPVKVLASHDYICLGEITRAYVTGPFKEYTIFKVQMFDSGEELLPVPGINFNRNDNEPERSIGTLDEAREKYNTLVGKMKVKFFEEEIRGSQKQRDSAAQEEIEKQVRANREFIKSKTAEITGQLREMIHQKNAEVLFSDKKIRAMVDDLQLLETLKKY